MSRVATAQLPPSPTSSLTYIDNRSDPMDSEPFTSPIKDSAAHFRFSPYPKRRALHPAHKHPYAISPQSRGPCSNLQVADHGLSPSQAREIFLHGIEALPNDILRSAVLEKYASTERSRHQLLLATWDLEGTKRKVHTLERMQHHLETSHSLTESEYKFWLDMYTDRGLPDLSEDELFYGSQTPSMAQEADRDATELSLMVEYAKERGLNVDSAVDEYGAESDEEAAAFSNSLELRKGVVSCE